MVVVGAGPGGYVAAIRAAQLGLKACVIEKDKPGGVCLNWGCIPSKCIIHQAEIFHSLTEMEEAGVKIDRSDFEYAKVQAKSREATQQLSNGVTGLLRKNKVDLIKATATVAAKGRVSLDNGKEVAARNLIIATGSRAMVVPGFEFDEQQVLSSYGILAMTSLPESVIILGAGAIGCEFAYVLNAFGVKVTLVEMASHILPSEDYEVVKVLEHSFARSGIELLTGVRATGLKKTRSAVTVFVEDAAGGETRLKAEKVLAVLGRTPNTGDIGLEAVGVRTDERGYVPVGDYCETNVKGIFAIGDITPTPALAHVASKEGEIAVEYIAGRSPASRTVDSELVPSAIYCKPQIAGIGLREEKALAEGI